MAERRLDATALLDWADTSVTDLISHTDEINRLNVYPVADCDTGTNMLFTMRSALERAASVAQSGDITRVTAALAAGAAHGARGNSGMILSQILQAMADVAAEAGTEVESDSALADIDAALFGAALRHGYTLVIEAMGGVAVAGTVVSVLGAAAEAVGHRATEGAGLPTALIAGGEAAAAALQRTTQQLEVLARAGVVDAGGRGLLVLLDAMTATVTGTRPHRQAYRPAPPTSGEATAGQPEPEFEVMYLLGGCAPAGLDGLRAALQGLGESVAIAASTDGRHSVHVHTDDAGAAVEAGLACGEVSRIRIAALATGRVSPGGWSSRRAVLAVVDGDAAGELFRREGARVLRPATHLVDPVNGVSADELLRVLVDIGANQVLVLPNGYVAAEDLVAACAAGISRGIDVVPVPSGSMAAGLAALAVHDPDRPAVDDGYAMARAAAAARHGSVRVATGKALTWAGPCEPGDGLGISGDEVVVVADDVATAAARLTDLLLSSGGELVTVLIGAACPPGVADVLAEHVHRRHPGTEFVSYPTGHRGDAVLIGVE